MPGSPANIGGTKGDEPVATTRLLKRTRVRSSTASRSGARICACPAAARRAARARGSPPPRTTRSGRARAGAARAPPAHRSAAARRDPRTARRLDRVRRVSRRDQQLRRHAADPRAGGPERSAIDQQAPTPPPCAPLAGPTAPPSPHRSPRHRRVQHHASASITLESSAAGARRPRPQASRARPDPARGRAPPVCRGAAGIPDPRDMSGTSIPSACSSATAASAQP
jgi:hypothetical protein